MLRKDCIMEKIQLKDGTTYQIQNGASSNVIVVVVTSIHDVATLFDTLTEDNLSEFKFLNESGEECATLFNKYISDTIHVQKVNSDLYNCSIRLYDVDMIAKAIHDLQKKQEELSSTQEIQAEAIQELAGLF